MKKYLRSCVNTIFLMLGRKCNFNCRYCMQLATPEKLHDLSTEINEDIYEFIEEIANNQDTPPVSLHFYGGEPLVYFNKLKEVVENTKHIKGIKYSVITNGSLITKEISEFFNKYEFNVSVSWDGSRSSETRLIDVMDKNLDNLLTVNNLGIGAVLNHYTDLNQILDDIQKIDNLYRDIHGYHLSVNIDEIYDSGLYDRSLLNVDYELIRSQMKELVNIALQHRCSKLPVNKDEFDNKYYIKVTYVDQYITRVISKIKNLESKIPTICFCGNGYWTLNMDLEGNLYNCHNDDNILGNIYTPFFEYLENARNHDPTAYFYKTMCKDCPVNILCESGCKLLTEEVRRESFCKLKKAVFEPVIEGIIEYSKSL